MKPTAGLKMLEITANIMGEPGVIHPSIIWDNNAAALVDTGYPGQAQPIREAIEAAGVAFSKLSTIILTHQDIDHVGSLASLLAESPHPIEVLSHEEEKPYIQGEKQAVKVAKLEDNLENLPEKMRVIYQHLKNFYASNKVKIDRPLLDGQELPIAGGITVIHTPGHTPGHICLYHKASRTLIAGDALGVDNGVLIRTPDFANSDVGLSRQSLKKLGQYDIQAVICYHGGFYNTNVNLRIAELAKS